MTATPRHLLLRWLTFLAGIFCMALGIAITTRAELGTTPITSLPYVASLGFSPSMGFFTIIMNLALVGMQVLVMRATGRHFPRIQYLQIVVSLLFGFLIDFWMVIIPDFAAQPYALRLLALAAGTVVLAFGVFVEVSADVVMMPGEGAVMVLSLVSQRDFGLLKSAFDVSIVLMGVLLSLALFQELRGIREGTLVSAVCCGLVVKAFFSLKKRLSARRSASRLHV